MAKKAPKSVTTAVEVAIAQKFLRLLHADAMNVYLIDVIIAWLRYNEVGGKIQGNNPFGLSTTNHIVYQYGRATTYTKQKFASVAAGLAATAKALRTNPAYASIYAAISRHETADKDRQAQAEDFISGLAQAAWGGDTFNDPTGQLWGQDSHGKAYAKNKLLLLWMSLLGHPINLPATPSKPVQQVIRPTQKISTSNNIQHPNYIQPYAALHFYEARTGGKPTILPPSEVH